MEGITRKKPSAYLDSMIYNYDNIFVAAEDSCIFIYSISNPEPIIALDIGYRVTGVKCVGKDLVLASFQNGINPFIAIITFDIFNKSCSMGTIYR